MSQKSLSLVLVLFAFACSGIVRGAMHAPSDAGDAADIASDPVADTGTPDAPADLAPDPEAVAPVDAQDQVEARDGEDLEEAGDPMTDADTAEAIPDVPQDEATASPVCPNGVCEPGENFKTCFEDCHCGDGKCQVEEGETMKSCPEDCCECGDCECNPMDCGETAEKCPVDCAFSCGDHVMSPGESPRCCVLDACWTGVGSGCGDGMCMGPQCGEDPDLCPQDCSTTACGNKECDIGENPFICPEDCLYKVCGNGSCEPPAESVDLCPIDCTPGCGDCTCGTGENFIACPMDCGSYGDGVCSPCLNENAENSPKDCS